MILTISRLLGLSGSVGAIGLWSAFSFLNPYGYQGLTEGVYIVAAIMVLLAIVGLAAMLQAKPSIMLVVFGLSFVPVGIYFLGTPGIFRWIGVFNILFLVSALLHLVPLGNNRRETAM